MISCDSTDRNKSSAGTGGVGCCTVLFLIFLVLKLSGVGSIADWSWWWVTIPLWGPAALVISLLMMIAAGAGVIAGVMGVCIWLKS